MEKEYFLKWLKKFYLMNPKQKTKLIKKAEKENKDFANWLNMVRDFDEEMQKGLINELSEVIW